MLPPRPEGLSRGTEEDLTYIAHLYEYYGCRRKATHQMLPMHRFRELVGPDSGLGEEELEELRHQFHSLAEILVDIASDRLARNMASEEARETQEDTEVY